MKANKLLIMFLIIICLFSCDTAYRITTRINPDGSASREIYAKADNEYMTGNSTKSPYLFSFDPEEWEITKFDTIIHYNFMGTKEEFNMMIAKETTSIDLLSNALEPISFKENLAKPKEQLQKHFKWFYTYYTYTCTYREIEDKGPVPLSNYITPEEQQLLFRGDFSAYNFMNGIELSEMLENIKERFSEWFLKSQYEISYEIILSYYHSMEQEDYANLLNNAKETLYTISRKKDMDSYSPALVSKLCDEYYKGNHFTDFYLKHAAKLDEEYDARTHSVELFGYSINYELEMPGSVISTNASIQDNHLLKWKIDGFRILTDDYQLEASSRIINMWAIAITALIILIAIASFFFKLKKPVNKSL